MESDFDNHLTSWVTEFVAGNPVWKITSSSNHDKLTLKIKHWGKINKLINNYSAKLIKVLKLRQAGKFQTFENGESCRSIKEHYNLMSKDGIIKA